MRDKIKDLFNKVDQYIIESKEQAEQFRLMFLSRKGELSNLFNDFKNVAAEDKKEIGLLINQLKDKIQQRYDDAKNNIDNTSTVNTNAEDYTRPGFPFETGTSHPLTIIRQKIISTFENIGFTVASGPEVEDDWHNFSALNFPENHPARDMQDTFFIDEKFALRTHTSSVQIRLMENNKPPFRALMPGRVYRNEAISARAHCFFHQVEGLYIDKNVSFADMKQTLLYFSKEIFGEQTKIRLRPSYFPFTEPSAEMDVSCFICHSKGCSVCKHSGWVEILGCGMVDPAVLQNCNIDPEVYSGFAFGMGIERIAMLKYRVNDLRLFSENDIRFLKQFNAANE
ncbi:MAG: phenylalanine--tRNA ligase subunit alpha [Bacteroidia bacterium]|nr:phenylalanine--tRNA ligase subunit alpha [Bacteroidia bacterium]MCZ2249214.1 phenylalanine--tRNA ligase subunit alpha [Bacteroidia bacterium]